MDTFNFPPAFEARMKEALKQQWPSFNAAHRDPSPTSIRLNPSKKSIEPQEKPIPWTTHGYYLTVRPKFTLDPLLHAGAYYVQEASSMFLEQVFRQHVPADTPLHILDLCAAPGGKSTHTASLLNPESLLVSNEVIRSRANILAENLQKWGSNNVVVTNNDPADFQSLPGFFDVIIVDAPCSGEGLFRKDPEAMKEWSEENVLLCSKRQRRILQDIWPALKENGILIYATCTYNALENEENLQWLAHEHTAEFLSLATDPSWGVEAVDKLGCIGYRFYPHHVTGEGFFLAALQKKENAHEISHRSKPSKGSFMSPAKKIMEQLHAWTVAPEHKTFIQRDDLIQFFPAHATRTIELLAKHLRLVTAGTFAATLKHDKLIPEHSLALSAEINKSIFHTLPLSHEEALQYLRKETLAITSSQKGFALAMFDDLPLGWVNILPNRINNLYPSEWRIRMTG